MIKGRGKGLSEIFAELQSTLHENYIYLFLHDDSNLIHNIYDINS